MFGGIVMSSNDVGIFIDGNNIFHSAKAEGVELDYSKLRNLLISDYCMGYLPKSIFYTGSDLSDHQRNFILWLKRNGFNVVEKPIKIDDNNRKYVSYYPEMITDMFFFGQHLDTIVIVGGSDILVYPIQRLSDLGIKIKLFAFEKSVSNKLLDVVDHYKILDTLIKDITKDTK